MLSQEGAFVMTQEERNTNKLQWELRIQTFQDSGLTQQQWCEKEGAKLSTLRYWLWHFRFINSRKNQSAAVGYRWFRFVLQAQGKRKIPMTACDRSGIRHRTYHSLGWRLWIGCLCRKAVMLLSKSWNSIFDFYCTIS